MTDRDGLGSVAKRAEHSRGVLSPDWLTLRPVDASVRADSRRGSVSADLVADLVASRRRRVTRRSGRRRRWKLRGLRVRSSRGRVLSRATHPERRRRPRAGARGTGRGWCCASWGRSSHPRVRPCPRKCRSAAAGARFFLRPNACSLDADWWSGRYGSPHAEVQGVPSRCFTSTRGTFLRSATSSAGTLQAEDTVHARASVEPPPPPPPTRADGAGQRRCLAVARRLAPGARRTR